MPERSNPNLARRLRLAAELRRLREQAGMTGQQVRARLGWPSSSKLSNIEHGTTGVKQADLERLLVLYGVSDEHQAGLFALAEESRDAGHPLVAGPSESDEQRRLLDAERDAASIWIWEPQIFPGLFQVPAYSRALMLPWARLFTLPRGETDRRIAARQLRQDVLNRIPPLELSVVIDESVLYRRIGGPAVMAEQLARMLAASELPGVDVRILPLDGEHVIGTGAFNYFRFRQIHDVPLHDLVTLDHLTGTSYADSEYETHQYAVAFESLRHDALDPGESRTLISRAAVATSNRGG